MSAKAVSTSADGRAKFRLTLETVNARVKDMQYAVRGQLPIEAMKIEDAIANVRIWAVLDYYNNFMVAFIYIGHR